MTKPIFVVDSDDVALATGFMKKRWIEENMAGDQLEDRTRTIASISPYECNFTQLAPIIGRDKYFQMIDVVYGPEWTVATEPVPGALESIKALSEMGSIYSLTARRAWEVGNIADWNQAKGIDAYTQLLAHVDDPRFSEITAIAGSKKVGISKHLGARMLVDDDERHMPTKPVEGLDCLLFGPSDRTRVMAALPHVIVAPTWNDVVQYARTYATR